MTTTSLKREIDFGLVDDLAFAAERGRLNLAALPAAFVARRLGPYLELLQLQRGGGLPDLAGADGLDLSPMATLLNAVRGNADRWLGPSGALGLLKARSSGIDWTTFAMDAKRAAVGAGLASEWAAGMVAAMLELRDNISEHSGAAPTGFVAFQARPGAFEFVASDLGVGVLATLRGAPEYTGLSDHGEALRLTLTEGASRFGFDEGRGYGFRPLFSGLANRHGALRFRSGNAALRIDGTSPTLVSAQVAAKPRLTGLFVSVTCSTNTAP